MKYVMLKPASSQCNLHCKYCFYQDEAELRDVVSYGNMSLDTLAHVVQKICQSGDRECVFVFQGGEPTLRGLPFYEELIRLQQPYRKQGISISNTIQTNGLLIDEQWASFLAQNEFLVGLSLDGTEKINDSLRVDSRGDGSFRKIKRAAQLLEQANVPFNIVTVVTKKIAGHAQEVYKAYLDNGWRYLQFIPCLDPYGETPGLHPYSLTPDAYGKFLCKLFDLWYQDAILGEIVYIRYFENILGMLLGFPPESCGVCGTCAREYVIEADGSVYPCDFYVMDAYRLGNINRDTLVKIDANDRQKQFILRSRQKPANCISCRWKAFCNGGCVRNRDDGKTLRENYYCSAFHAFFDYTMPRFEKLAQLAKKRHDEQNKCEG